MATNRREFDHDYDSIELTIPAKTVANVQSTTIYNTSDNQSDHSIQIDGSEAHGNEHSNWLFDQVAQWIFHRDYLDRALERHHITSKPKV